MMLKAAKHLVWVTLILSGLTGAVATEEVATAEAFTALLTEAELNFVPIENSSTQEPRTNAVMDHTNAPCGLKTVRWKSVMWCGHSNDYVSSTMTRMVQRLIPITFFR